MKKMNFFNRVVLLISALLMTGGVYAQTNFYAWDMTTTRPLSGTNSQGIACGNLAFTEKDITIECWINIASANFVPGATVLSTRHDGTYGFSLDVTTDGKQLRAFFRNDNGDKLNGRADFVFPFFFEKADIVDKWVHVAIVFSSTDDVSRSYLNGEVYQDLVKSTDPYTPYNIGWVGNIKGDGNNVGGLRLGYWYASASAMLYAKVADVRIWSVGRTDAQIKANYNKNLTGTYEDNPGLYLNYRFYTYERGFVNDANPTVAANKGWCNPEASWNTYYKRETLSEFPKNLAINDGNLSWDTGAGEWEVSIFEDGSDVEAFTDTIASNTISLNDIEALNEGTTYYAKVRTLNNGVWSGLVSSSTFTVNKTVGLDKIEKGMTFFVNNGSLIVNAENFQILNIYAVSGQLVRSINIVAGKNVINDLPKGFYLVNNQKIVIR